ncbi:UNVERIFIED_CONTAM: putative E3 ubiquitin ligase SUD1 [Sesamum angustifolium]|uniref:E3 ubiquitin ligase SUD1 n=1 Tax=Sesamum angustifolium TaxID=2727405 RepID=A0AAW2QVX6_9LAMI
MSEIVLFVDDFRSSVCRICHEEEFESSKSLEAPCACSGTVKFAHRDCVQRWCNEKGNTTCEICLQRKTGFAFKFWIVEVALVSPVSKEFSPLYFSYSIFLDRKRNWGSLEVPRDEQEQENRGEILDTEYSECASSAERSAYCCRSVALIFTALLLIRHLFAVLTGGAGEYPFSLLTVLIVKASGILLPMYVLIRIIAALHNGVTHHYRNSYSDTRSDDEANDDEEQNV